MMPRDPQPLGSFARRQERHRRMATRALSRRETCTTRASRMPDRAALPEAVALRCEGCGARTEVARETLEATLRRAPVARLCAGCVPGEVA